MPGAEFKYKDAKYKTPENFIEYMEQHYLADRKLAYSYENQGVFIGLVRYLKQMEPKFNKWADENPERINVEDLIAVREIIRLEGQKVNVMLADKAKDLSTKIPKGMSAETMIYLLSKREDEEDIAIWHDINSPADHKHETVAASPIALPKPLTITTSVQSPPATESGVNTPHHLFSPTRAANSPPIAAASPTSASPSSASPTTGTPHSAFSPKDADTVLSSPVARELEAAMKQNMEMSAGMRLVS